MSNQFPNRKPNVSTPPAPSTRPAEGMPRNSEISAIRPAMTFGSAPPGRVTSIPPSRPRVGPKKRILLIEPVLSSAQLHQTMLGVWFDVVTEADPMTALEGLSTIGHSYDLALCNVESLTISGFEFVRRMKLDLVARTTPVVLFNGEENPADVIRAIQLGVRHYVGKTTSAGELARKLYGLLYRINAPV